MNEGEARAGAVERWLAALERRHLGELTFQEAARALRALSSCYVERRSRLASGAALESRGKRAAFALFYGPLHFFVVRDVVRGLGASIPSIRHLVDLGCGTGAAGAAWALQAGCPRIQGIDRNPWALAEARWTYRQLTLAGRVVQADLARIPLQPGPGTGILAAYSVNELAESPRRALSDALRLAATRRARILIVEPIARRSAPWWAEWVRAAREAGGRADEWRFPASLPPLQRQLARAAGLEPNELTARSILW